MNESPKHLPDNAKMVFKGIIYEVWQWEQEMYDGSKRTFEALRRNFTVETLAIADGKIIIEEQTQPSQDKVFFSLPGGVADQEGTLLENAKRELEEETGYLSEDWVFWKNITPLMRMEYEVHYFIARNAKQVHAPALDAGEKIKLRLVTFDELFDIAEDDRFRGSEFIRLLYNIRTNPEKRSAFKSLLGI